MAENDWITRVIYFTLLIGAPCPSIFLLGPTLVGSDFLHIFSEKGAAKLNIIDLDTEIRKRSTNMENIYSKK